MIALARHLLSRPAESLDLVIRYGERLRWASWVCDQDGRAIVWSITKFVEQFHRLPDSVATLQHFVSTSTEVRVQQRCKETLNGLAELEEETGEIPGDLEMLIQQAITAGRTTYFKGNAETAARLASNSLPPREYQSIIKKFGQGPDAAANYIRDAILNDGGLAAHRDISGDVHQNLGLVSKSLDDALENPHEGRLFTGIKVVDESVLIGPKHAKYIGICAPTGGGKSTFVRSLLHSFACQGANVLYIPREQSTMEASEQFVWLHADAMGLGHELPSLFEWKATPHRVTQHQREIKDRVIADYNERRSITGIVDVAPASTMSDVLTHYHSYKQRNNYSVICIDYLAKLAVDGKDEIAEHRRDFDRFHDLCQSENLVCITPLQCNREGLKAAESSGESDLDGLYGVLPGVNAVEYYSNATQGMDLVIGAFFRGTLKAQNKIRISGLKIRGSAKDIPPTDLYIDPITRRVRDFQIGYNHRSHRGNAKRSDSKDDI
jgi:KaiC/GvpD/RAD55 family RecA-like ATPase